MIIWEMLHPKMTIDHLGFISSFLSDEIPLSAREQLDAHYQHGGGWRSIKGFRRIADTYNLKYPGDPVIKPLAKTKLRNETIIFYPSALIGIWQEDGSFEIARMD